MLAALALAASLTTLAVPYLPQTDALCGGAAAAMVFRYWGDAHAGVGEFVGLVDRRAGGIAADALVAAIRLRGWDARRSRGTVEWLAREVANGHPAIVLVAAGRGPYHYEVVIGVGDGDVVVHDPAWGPSRRIADADFVRAWRPTGFWTLIVQPRPGKAAAEASDTAASAAVERDPAPGSLAERAGIEFADRRWQDAARLAQAAVQTDPHDRYAWDVLGSSRFMQDDQAGALAAWNAIDRPRVDLVQIDGLARTRYQTVAEWLRLQSNAMLTPGGFRLADRRLQELPNRSASRLALRPEADGWTDVRATIVERPIAPAGVSGWTAKAVASVVDRELRVALPDPSGQGALWSASWRWWSHRPAASIAFAAPRSGFWPGVWRVAADWDAQAYSGGAAAGQIPSRETHMRGAVSVSDWIDADLRYSATAGLDTWSNPAAEIRAPFIGASLERRWLDDRWSLAGSATAWPGHFTGASLRAAFRSSSAPDRWVQLADAGTEWVSDRAPLGLWPGAGEGYARAPLLRAHPLLDGGTLDGGEQSALGRTLVYANAETERWFEWPGLVRLGAAAFSDAAAAGRRASGTGSVLHVDVGGGLRMRIPGSGTLRVDVAHGVDDGANAVTVGWQSPL